jgi:hypothetical protein
MEEVRCIYTQFWSENVQEIEELGVDGRIIFERISVKLDVALWTGFIWLRTRAHDQ